MVNRTFGLPSLRLYFFSLVNLGQHLFLPAKGLRKTCLSFALCPPICEDPTTSPVNKVRTALPAPCSVPFLKVPAPLTRSPTTAEGAGPTLPFIALPQYHTY